MDFDLNNLKVLYQLLSIAVTDLLDGTEYAEPVNDVVNVPNPKQYLLSRCIDKAVSSYFGSLKLFRYATQINLEEISKIKKGHPEHASLEDEADAQLLAAAIRPCLEMYLYLNSLERSDDDEGVQDELCRVLLTKFFNDDMRERLRTCETVYGTRPAYLAEMVSGFTKNLNKIRLNLKNNQLSDILFKERTIFENAMNQPDAFNKISMGVDPYMSFTRLAFKLHFITQNTPCTPKERYQNFSWAAVLIMNLLSKIFKHSKVDKPESVLQFEQIIGVADQKSTNKANIKKGDLLLYEWGVARVLDVVCSEPPRETYRVEYVVNFVKGYPVETVPRVFMKGAVDGTRLRSVLSDIETQYGKKELYEIFPTIDVSERSNLWFKVFSCSPIAHHDLSSGNLKKLREYVEESE